MLFRSIPDSVTSIGNETFYGCRNLVSIDFNGTMEQWNSISKSIGYGLPDACKIICTDGTIES